MKLDHTFLNYWVDIFSSPKDENLEVSISLITTFLLIKFTFDTRDFPCENYLWRNVINVEMKTCWYKKETILISMFSIDLTIAGEPIRAGGPARDPLKVHLIRTWKCCVKNRLLLVIMGSYKWLQVVGRQSVGAASHFLKAGTRECTAAPALLPPSWRNGIRLLLAKPRRWFLRFGAQYRRCATTTTTTTTVYVFAV